MQSLILASSSAYRRQILDKLGTPYQWQAPDIDETPFNQENPTRLVERLSQQKALALADTFPNHLIIGSDQVAVIDDRIIGKPHTRDNAIKQLTHASGKTLSFITGLSLLNSGSGKIHTTTNHYAVTFRKLTQQQIENYLDKEKPFDCAGSFKSEALGIALIERMEGSDPNALIGLPLIQLIDLLSLEGLSIL